MKKPTVYTSLIWCFLILAILFQLNSSRPFSIANFPDARLRDFRWIYTAGRCWVNGKNPYLSSVFEKEWRKKFGHFRNKPFAYPPTFAVIAIPVGLIDWTYAIYLYDSLNILSLIVTLVYIYFIIGLYKPHTRKLNSSIVALLIPVVLLGSISGVIYIGQASLIATMGIAGAIYHGLRKQYWLSGSWVVIASIKPQLCILPLIWLCFNEPKLLGRSAIMVGLTLLGTMLVSRNINIFNGYLDSLIMHTQTPFNLVDNLTASYRLLDNGSANWINPLIALTLTLLLSWKYNYSLNVLLLTFYLTILFMRIHGYDFSLLVIPFALTIGLRWSWAVFLALIIIGRPNAVIAILKTLEITLSQSTLIYLQGLSIVFLVSDILWKLISKRWQTVDAIRKLPDVKINNYE